MSSTSDFSWVSYFHLLGDFWKCREVLLGLVFTLVLVKSVQQQFPRKRNKSTKFENGQGHTVEALEKGDKYAGFNALPGPRPFPIRYIGNIFTFMFKSDVIEIFQNLSRKYGDMFRLVGLGDDYVFLNSPQSVQALLTSTDNGHLAKGGLEEIIWPKDVRSLVSFTGEEWRIRRKMLNRSFTYKSLQIYNTSFNRHSEKMVQKLENLFSDGKVHDVDKIVQHCVFGVTSETLMGVELSEQDAAVFCECTETIMANIFQRVYRPWLYPEWIWRLHPLSRKTNEVMFTMGEIAKQIIKKHFENMDSKMVNSAQDLGYDSDTEEAMGTTFTGNMVEVMLHHGVSDHDIFLEVVVLLTIAHDTTSVSVLFALFLLALNPEHQELCRNEIDAVFNDPLNYKNGSLEFHALKELKHLERCLLEAQRIYPLGTAMRKLETPLKIDEDLSIPAGVTAFYMSHTLHMNPKYFPRPEVFDPDRFSSEQVKSRHPYAFVPFSGGPRGCIGMKLAIVELKVILAKILYHFEVGTIDKKEDVKLLFNGIPKPAKPINFIFKKRKINCRGC